MYTSNVGYSTSIFQILFTDIHMRHSFVYSNCVVSQHNILVSLSFTIQHPYFKIQYSTSLIKTSRIDNSTYAFQILFTCDIRLCVLPQPFQHRMLDVCVLWCRVRYACSAMQHSCLDIEFSPSGLAPSVSRVSRILRLTAGVR